MTAVILRGDAAHLPLPDESVDLIVTSPPYFGLRAYSDGGEVYDGQIGAEATPREYITALIGCTREWTRALKPEGSIFVNLGDSYNSGKGAPGRTTTDPKNAGRNARRTVRSPLDYGLGLPRKTLLGLPWRYAVGCMDQLGLILRAEIIWAKPNGMPESAQDRVRRSHEQVFHFTKQSRYYSAVDAIRGAHAPASLARSRRAYNAGDQFSVGTPNTLDPGQFCNPRGRLPGSVWEIPPAPLVILPAMAHARCCGGKPVVGCEDGLAHHAAFPPELCRRIILGWSPSGICTRWGVGRPIIADAGGVRGKSDPVRDTPSRFRPPLGAQNGNKEGKLRALTGYACACPQPDAPALPSLVLDPFGGTGTTAMVADVFGRTGITVDKSADYCRIAAWRTADPGERARALGVPKPPPVTDGQGSLFDGLEAS